MRTTLIHFLLVIALLAPGLCQAQSVKVSDPRPELRDNIIHILYDILDSQPVDEFQVSLTVLDEDGQEIPARALSGDIGDLVYGGESKEIRWDLSADEIEMEAQIYFKIRVKLIPPPEPVVEVPPSNEEEEKVKMDEVIIDESAGQEDPVIDDRVDPVKAENLTVAETSNLEFNRAGIVLQSLPFPGLGLSRVTGKPHWLRGVAGYACIAGSVVLNRKAIETYSGIAALENYNSKHELYKQSRSQDLTSEMLAYAAVAFWVSDLFWTIAGTSDLKKIPMAGNGISISSGIDPVFSVPLVGLTIRF